jgi:hypothetical protein
MKGAVYILSAKPLTGRGTLWGDQACAGGAAGEAAVRARVGPAVCDGCSDHALVRMSLLPFPFKRAQVSPSSHGYSRGRRSCTGGGRKWPFSVRRFVSLAYASRTGTVMRRCEPALPSTRALFCARPSALWRARRIRWQTHTPPWASCGACVPAAM